ncbi:MAG: hypothetical protein NXY57DRAFT_970240, partial [Lentinula lateritia]
LWRTATIFSREQAIDPVVALKRLKAQDETAKKDRKGKGKALFFLASDSGSSESSNELELESPALSSTQKLKRKRSSVGDEALEERNSKRPKTSLAKEYLEISDLDENSAKVRFTDSEDQEVSSEGVNDHGDLKDPGIEDRGDEGEDSPGFKKVEVSLKDESRRSSSSSGSSTASSEQDAGEDRVDEDDDDEEEDSWDNWT